MSVILKFRPSDSEIGDLFDACYHADEIQHREHHQGGITMHNQGCFQWRLWATDPDTQERLIAYRRAAQYGFYTEWPGHITLWDNSEGL